MRKKTRCCARSASLAFFLHFSILFSLFRAKARVIFSERARAAPSSSLLSAAPSPSNKGNRTSFEKREQLPPWHLLLLSPFVFSSSSTHFRIVFLPLFLSLAPDPGFFRASESENGPKMTKRKQEEGSIEAAAKGKKKHAAALASTAAAKNDAASADDARPPKKKTSKTATTTFVDGDCPEEAIPVPVWADGLPEFRNKEKVLILSSRGITHR